ncbi:hypothetical protein D9619_006934 [Psilocybe cf. subviscida]|uniref:Uncharacterized protein n=1 Tax=Psilocybe cf. subviscida TaxID=2480587 RepID=A0A8H5B219_9AGAR|nr:hypothetical protein D9619_006934 [Psilocybe cf. subviscida]
MLGWRRTITTLQRLAHNTRPTPHFRPHWIVGNGDASQKVHLLQLVQLQRAASSGRMKRVVQTLDPGQLSFLDQGTLELSGVSNPEVHITTPDGPVRVPLYYYYAENRKKVPFPPNTSGALYFHHLTGDSTNSQIRFRLCNDAVNFHHGTDLLLPDGQPWKVSVSDMARSPNSYGLFAIALAEDFPDLPNLVQSRIVSTFSPPKLTESGQGVFNISGLTSPRVGCAHTELAGTSLRNMQFTYFRKDGELQPFPDDTVGVFYYKQSTTSPKRIGEIRFRMCANVSSFNEGVDLCLPSGDTWHIDSNGLLFSSEKHQGLYTALVQEGLLEQPFHFPSVPTDLHTRFSKTSNLGTFSQPFVVDLSQNSITLWLRIGSTWEHTRFPGLFPARVSVKDAPFSGRVVARLERYPQNLLKVSPSKSPLLALRFLEMLTPIRRVNDTNHILKPTAGMLHLTRQRGGGYLPWGYNPTHPEIREKLMAFMER